MEGMTHFLNAVAADLIIYVVVTRGALAVSNGLTLLTRRR
jgi:hypothetical protein